jgi:hypothetical protein
MHTCGVAREPTSIPVLESESEFLLNTSRSSQYASSSGPSLSNDWRSAAWTRRSAATEGHVSFNVRVRLPRPCACTPTMARGTRRPAAAHPLAVMDSEQSVALMRHRLVDAQRRLPCATLVLRPLPIASRARNEQAPRIVSRLTAGVAIESFFQKRLRAALSAAILWATREGARRHEPFATICGGVAQGPCQAVLPAASVYTACAHRR